MAYIVGIRASSDKLALQTYKPMAMVPETTHAIESLVAEQKIQQM